MFFSCFVIDWNLLNDVKWIHVKRQSSFCAFGYQSQLQSYYRVLLLPADESSQIINSKNDRKTQKKIKMTLFSSSIHSSGPSLYCCSSPTSCWGSATLWCTSVHHTRGKCSWHLFFCFFLWQRHSESTLSFSSFFNLPLFWALWIGNYSIQFVYLHNLRFHIVSNGDHFSNTVRNCQIVEIMTKNRSLWVSSCT